MYKRQINGNASSAYLTESVNLWHSRLGHVNYASTQTSHLEQFSVLKLEISLLDIAGFEVN